MLPLRTALIAALFTATAFAQTTLRYDLAPGDHLVFHETLDRSMQSKTNAFSTHAEWTNHVLITSDPQHPGHFLVGTQRNRAAATLVHSTTNGKDTTNSDRKDFDKRLALRGSAFVEANLFDRTGLPVDPISALREWTSQVLFDVRELMPLPTEQVVTGSSWRGTSLLGVSTRYAGNEPLHGHDCIRLEGAGRSNTFTVKSWFCPATGLVEKIEAAGKYGIFDSTIEEKISFEFTSRTRGESVATWLAAKETREAPLQMAMLHSAVPIDRQALLALLSSDDPHTQRRALALCFRRSCNLSPQEIEPLAKSEDPRLRSLARLINVLAPKPAVCGDRQSSVVFPPGDFWLTLDTGPTPGWPFIVHVPEEYRPDGTLPAIVDLSGGAGHALDAMNGTRATEETAGYILIYPQASDYWWEPASTALTRELLREVKTRFAIDPDRLYLSGSSNGGTGAFLYASLWPDQFAAAVPMMGAGYNTPAKEKPLGENTSALPLLFIHGDDDKIIPMQSSVDTVNHLKGTDRSAPVELTILPGKSHELSLDNNGDKALPFLARYTRNPYPHKLHIRMRDLSNPRQYWVEVLDKADGLAEIDARIEGSTIEVKTKRIRKLRLLLRPELIGGTVNVLWNGKHAWSGSVSNNCDAIRSTAPDHDLALGYTQEVMLSGDPE